MQLKTSNEFVYNSKAAVIKITGAGIIYKLCVTLQSRSDPIKCSILIGNQIPLEVR